MLLLGRDGLEVVGDAAQQSIDVARHELDALLAGIQPRQPQQVLDEPLHPRRMTMDDVEEFLSRVSIVRIVKQRFGVSLDGCERRAQLVRNVGDEVAAHLVGFAQLGDVVHAPARRRGRP